MLKIKEKDFLRLKIKVKWIKHEIKINKDRDRDRDRRLILLRFLPRVSERFWKIISPSRKYTICTWQNRSNNNDNKKITKTRRILEVQSDLFQKGRDRENLIQGNISSFEEKEFNYNNGSLNPCAT